MANGGTSYIKSAFRRSARIWGFEETMSRVLPLKPNRRCRRLESHNVSRFLRRAGRHVVILTSTPPSRARTDAEFKDLDKFIKIIEGFKRQKEPTGAEDMILGTASPERMRHLEQVIERENYLHNAP